MRIEGWRSNTLGLRLDGEIVNGNAYGYSGLERVDSTTWRITQSQAPSALLSYLEREIQTLESRYLEVCATLSIVTARLVELGLIGTRLSPLTIDDEEEIE